MMIPSRVYVYNFLQATQQQLVYAHTAIVQLT